MADPDKGTDGTPIKPVSSLRSHFENMASLRPPRGQVSHALSQTPINRTRGQRDNNGPERSSLDIERRPSPVFSQRNLVINDPQIGARMPFDLKSLPKPSISPSRQRPLSMISLSSHQSPPTVTVDAPLSPQKPFVMPSARLPSISPTPSSSKANEMRPRSQHAVPTPPGRSAAASPVREMERLPAANRNNLPSLRLLPGDTNTNHPRLAANSGPPPVRRAEKPKIPVKPTASKSSTSLETNPIISSTRVSPFSTPSSSDDNLGSEAARSRSPLSMAKSEKESQLQQASVNPNPSVPKFGDHGDFYHSLLNSEAAPKVKPYLSPLPNDLPTSRPGLPPRRDPDKKPAQSPRPRPVSMLNRNRSEQDSRQNSGPLSKPRIPSGHSQTSADGKYSRPEIIPPTRRPETSISTRNRRNEADDWPMGQNVSQGLSHVLDANDTPDTEAPNSNTSPHSYPDTSNLNRRPPCLQKGVQKIDVYHDTKLFDVSSRYVCTTGLVTRAWDFSGNKVLNLGHDERDTRVTALAFKPGATPDDEGLRIWLGTNYGDIQEVDIPSQTVCYIKSAAHNRREILKIYRCQNSMWTLDDDGRLYIWPAGEDGLPSLELAPTARRVPRGHSFSLIIQDTLWIATGKEIRVFRPLSKDDAGFFVTKQALCQYGVGEITSGAVVTGRFHCVYFGHTDGKVTSYSTDDFSCLGVFNVSVYKINSLIGACSCLWAGFNSGTICVYDTSTQPWTTKKEWQAHPEHPVSNILVERSSLWKSGSLRVASIGMDSTVRFWDGMLEQDWLETDMQNHDTDYCSFREIKTVVVTWNAGASTPASLQYDDNDMGSFREMLHVESPPEILVFGFQELVDLDDKKLTARSIFKGNKKKDASEQEHMSRKYTAWRDFLVRFIEDNMPHDEPYHQLHTASMMGLFSCVFVKASLHRNISNLCAAEIKRGLGGLHGNKGAIILRFMLDDTSLCFVNCHLAAGQSQTVHRHNDAAAILESTILASERDQSVCCDRFVGGGDGKMILDHEICILNGDLNYRIDTMGRDTVIKAVKAKNFSKLLERDQLLVARRRTPGFRLRVFAESPIFFAPTYKYDVGSENYDSSEKHRAPAWCDRILYRGSGKIKQLEYRRHEVQVSDHRPVSGTFKMRIKTVSPDTRARIWNSCEERLEAFRQKASHEAKIEYLRDVLGVDPHEAKKLISQRV